MYKIKEIRVKSDKKDINGSVKDLVIRKLNDGSITIGSVSPGMDRNGIDPIFLPDGELAKKFPDIYQSLVEALK